MKNSHAVIQNTPADNSVTPEVISLTPNATGIPSEIPTTETQTATSLPTSTIPLSSSQTQSFCNQTGSIYLLVLGISPSNDSPQIGKGSDFIRLIHIDYDSAKASMVNIPRDLVIPAVTQSTPLNVVYKDAWQSAPGSEKDKDAVASEALSQIISTSFEIPIDYFIDIRMEQIAAMIDTIGGLEIEIPASFTTKNHVTFNPGRQTLNGAMTLEFVRSAQPGEQNGPTEQQIELIKAIQTKMISANLVSKAPALLSQFQDAVSTNLSPEQLINFVCLAGEIKLNNITFGTIDQPGLISGKEAIPDGIKTYLNSLY